MGNSVTVGIRSEETLLGFSKVEMDERGRMTGAKRGSEPLQRTSPIDNNKDGGERDFVVAKR